MKAFSASQARVSPVGGSKLILPPISANGFSIPQSDLDVRTQASLNMDMGASLDFKQNVSELVRALHKEQKMDNQRLKASLSLIQKLWKNVLDNPDNDKFRTLKTSNDKIRENITKFYNGSALLRLIGFQETYDNAMKETVLRMPSTLSIRHMKG